MSGMASQITGVLIVYSTVCSGADQRKHQISASLAILREIHRWAVEPPHKGPVTRKRFIWWRHHAARGSRFVVFCCDFVPVDFIYTTQVTLLALDYHNDCHSETTK